MGDLQYQMRDTHLTLKISRLGVAIAISILVHIAAMLGWWPKIFDSGKNAADPGDMSKKMRVLLPPLPQQPLVPPPPPSAAIEPQKPVVPPQRAPAARKQPPPPLMTRKAPAEPNVAAVPPTVPAPAAPPVEGDLSSMIAARRRARGEPAQAETPPAPVNEDMARRDRAVAANMATIRTPTLGDDPRRSGGIFEIRRMGVFDAEFLFYGWNKDINRRMSQVIEVKLGNNSDIRIAIVRRMIALIREHEREDFSWQSQRLGRVVTLSARLADTPGLEEFFMREFFENGRAPK
jgi:hypothetical protein